MGDGPHDPVGTAADMMTRAAQDAATHINQADKIYVGSRLLAVVVSAAKALAEMDATAPDPLIVDDRVREAADALHQVDAALRTHVRFSRG